MRFHRRHVLALAAGSAVLSPGLALAQARTPLLIEGKKTLYQRVLTRPGATLSPAAGGAGKPVAPFTLYYVYERREAGGKATLLVGAGSDGKTEGLIDEAATVPWRHAITVAFAKPGNRERVLFFRDRDSLTKLIDADDAAAQAQKITKEITDKGSLGAASPVIAAEPAVYVDVQKQFYLLPVLEASTTMLKTGNRVREVKVASITKDAATSTAPAAKGNSGIANYNSAVVFVIDATSSMQPYIDRTRQAMAEVLAQAESAKVLDRVRFGLVAFQDDPAKAKGMEYLAKVFVDPSQNASKEQFLAAMDKVKATPSSTRAFAEDAYAGLDKALRGLPWEKYGGRYIVYITDASAREGNSPFASTHMNTEQMRQQAQERGVAIYAVHLKTAEGAKDHQIAEAQFRNLSAWPGRGALYFPVEAGDPARFEQGIKQMATALVGQVKDPEQTLASSAQGAGKKGKDDIGDAVNAVGRAMVLAYLGREQGAKSPPMYEAWACDRDVKNRDVPTLDVRLLLTKNQLSDLQATVKRLIEAGTRGQLNPTDFFNQLRSAAVALGRDASKLGQGSAKNLEQSGLMGEYLEGLPFKSQLMSLDLNSWVNMGPGESQPILDNLNAKIALYQRFHDDVDRWVKLNDKAPDGERVYPVPFSALP